VAFCPEKIPNIKAAFYGKSLTVKDCTEMAALASRSSSVGSIMDDAWSRASQKFSTPEKDCSIVAEK